MEKMLDNSILKDLLARDMDLVKRAKNHRVEIDDEDNPIVKGGMRRYRHKSEMVGEIAIAQKDYDEAKRRLRYVPTRTKKKIDYASTHPIILYFILILFFKSTTARQMKNWRD